MPAGALSYTATDTQAVCTRGAASSTWMQSGRTAARMSEAELYHFDLAGYVIVRNVLSEDELRVANEAIDRQQLQPSPTYAGSSVALAGKLRPDGTGPITRLGNTEPLLEMGAFDVCADFPL